MARIFFASNASTLSKTILTGACLLMLSGCASTSERGAGRDSYNSYAEISDPFENINRATHGFNTAFDNAVAHPTVDLYRTVTPEPARKGLRNFLRNLRSPINFANQLLQGDLNGASTDFQRFAINTLVGAGGLFDVAAYEGMEGEYEDFGQTLAKWGVGHGPYLVVPFLGPSSMRDSFGYAVDLYADPVRLYLANTDRDTLGYAHMGATYLVLKDNLRDALTDLQKNSFDYYAALRSAYFQMRQAMVQDRGKGGLSAAPAIPDYDEE